MSGIGSEGSSKPVIVGRKNYPGNRSDVGWRHGTDVMGNARKVKCNYCSKIVSGGISRFKHHLAGTKEDTEPCISVPDEVKASMLKIICQAKENAARKKRLWSTIGDDDVDESVGGDSPTNLQRKGKEIQSLLKKLKTVGSGIGSVQFTINQLYKREQAEELSQQIARFFYASAIPFNCIKNPEFTKMIDLATKFGQGYKHPSYHDLREKYLNKEVHRINEYLVEFKQEWREVGCSIMSDGWTDRKRRSICNFLVNSPKGTVFMYSLDTSNISKTTDKVFEMLDQVVDKVGEENVIQIVTDNAANYKAAGQKLMAKREHLYWTPCAAHCIDLMLEDLEKQIKLHKDTITDGRRITTYIYGRAMVINMLRDFTKGRDLIRPATTRFATAYLTLSCLNELKGPLMTMFSSTEWKNSRFSSTKEGKQVARKVLDNRLWKNIVCCLKAAAPLIKVLRVVDSDERPAMGFIYYEMQRAKEKIKINFNNVKKSYESILKIVDERWEGQLHRPLHAAGYYLNPRFHYSPSFDDNCDIKQGLYDCLARLISDRDTRKKIDKQIVDFHYAKGMFGLESAKDNRAEMSPADWWYAYGDSCPELKKFAIRILSLTCSSSGCERNWSAFEMVRN